MDYTTKSSEISLTDTRQGMNIKKGSSRSKNKDS